MLNFFALYAIPLVFYLFFPFDSSYMWAAQCKCPKNPSLVVSSCFFVSLPSGVKLSATRLHLPSCRVPALRHADTGVELARPRLHQGGAHLPALTLTAVGKSWLGQRHGAPLRAAPAAVRKSSPVPMRWLGGAALHGHPWQLGWSSPYPTRCTRGGWADGGGCGTAPAPTPCCAPWHPRCCRWTPGRHGLVWVALCRLLDILWVYPRNI